MSFRVQIQNGRLSFRTDYNASRFSEWAKGNEGKWLTLEPEVTRRSLSQNAYYWVYLHIIEVETGNNASELHEYFKRIFLPPVTIKVLGNEMQIPSSTKDISKSDFTDYLQRICALTNIPLPNPEEVGYISNH